ncbi:MAG: hypothetical protein JXA14_21380 [Anaerolineae bacterium]|nr:hypothetical protein [Anaerolineae bacterium]
MASQTPYYEEYSPKREVRRGTILFIVFFVLTVVAVLGWAQYRLPNLYAPPPGEKHPEYQDYKDDPLLWHWKWVDREDEQQYLDWLLASLAGGSLYVLANIARFLPKVKTKEAQFRAFTGWYLSTVLRGCIIALVVLWFLTKVSFSIGGGADGGGGAGVAVDFTDMPGIVLSAIAFILAFYGRVARNQLDEIVRFLFPRAWALAHEAFEIVPKGGKVIFGGQLQFRTDPVADVTWTVEGQGSIDGTGLYTAPQRSDSVTPGTRASIRAALRTDPSISRVATVTLVPFKVVGEEIMGYGASQELSVDGAPSAGVKWILEPDSAGKLDTSTNVYSAPCSGEGHDQVMITAVSKEQDSEDSDSIIVKFKAK